MRSAAAPDPWCDTAILVVEQEALGSMSSHLEAFARYAESSGITDETRADIRKFIKHETARDAERKQEAAKAAMLWM